MALKDDLLSSLVQEGIDLAHKLPDNVVDFNTERLSRRPTPNTAVRTADLLRTILKEIEEGRHGDPEQLKCSITLVKQFDTYEETESFRAKLNLPEELMYLRITGEDLLKRYSVYDGPQE